MTFLLFGKRPVPMDGDLQRVYDNDDDEEVDNGKFFD